MPTIPAMARTPDPDGTLLVCDVGGVLLTRGLYLLLDELAAAAGRDPAQLRDFFTTHQRRCLWAGPGWAETTFWAELVSVAGPPERVGTPGAWRARLRTLLRPLEPGTGVVKRWASTGPVWLVSNHRRAWLEPPLRASGVWQLAARRFVSEEVGIVKPDPAMYRAVLDAWGGAPDQVVCVDADPRSVAAAREVGLRAVLADPAGRWASLFDCSLPAAA